MTLVNILSSETFRLIGSKTVQDLGVVQKTTCKFLVGQTFSIVKILRRTIFL